MQLNIKDKIINDKEFFVFDAIINGITIDSILEIRKFETAFYNIVVFITTDYIEHHINENDLTSVLATFYDEEWKQMSNDEIDITNEVIQQLKSLKDVY